MGGKTVMAAGLPGPGTRSVAPASELVAGVRENRDRSQDAAYRVASLTESVPGSDPVPFPCEPHAIRI